MANLRPNGNVESITTVGLELTRHLLRKPPNWEGVVDLPGGGSMIIRTAERLGQNVLVCAVLISEDAVFGDAAIGEILGLTPRVAAVARLLALRQTNREIAAELRISENTARRYTELALKQLGLKTRFEVRSHLRTAAAAFMASGSR